ncbi:MAG: BLUF domain-containing protein [Moraxellaceae bacterium]
MSNLMRLVMFSKAAFSTATSSSEIEADLLSILSQTRRANAQRQLTGVLYYGEGYFLHCLEGAAATMTEVMNRMALDPRHCNLEVVVLEPIQQLSFAQWRMRFARTDHAVTHMLRQHGMTRFQPYEFPLSLVNALVETAAQPDYQRCA